MSDSAEQFRHQASRRATLGVITCPSCYGSLKPDTKWCPTCNFTGNDSTAMFPDPPPPLLPLLDAAGLLKADDIRKIETARDRLRRRFPQFHWRICTVSLPVDTRLSLFGFWLLNVCPLYDQETLADRNSTVLLLINADTGQAAVVPGYAVEPFLSDEEWKAILRTMIEPWKSGNPSAAILQFFKSSRRHLDLSWKRFGTRHSSGNVS